jgi:bifunctional NMN adenylyltransferase/nudix hydrolase
MIRLMLTAEENARVVFAHIEDQGNMPKWTKAVRKAANAVEPDNKAITLIGHSKDRSSFYLKGFKGWSATDVDNFMNLSATTFRNAFFKPGDMSAEDLEVLMAGLHPEVVMWLNEFSKTLAFDHLVDERIKVEGDIAKYGRGPFVTATSIIIQGDHVLLIERGGHPFRGCLALPGGFVEPDERIEDAMVREVTEETGLKLSELTVRRSLIRTDYWDNPWRDPRARIIDFTGLFYLNPTPPSDITDPKEIAKYLALPRVKGMDDAKRAFWKPISEIRREDMAFDHYMQLMHALDFIPREI